MYYNVLNHRMSKFIEINKIIGDVQNGQGCDTSDLYHSFRINISFVISFLVTSMNSDPCMYTRSAHVE